ncbi:MAG: F0F1 ATP synthase subunit B [Deltaproteobacteria bacterium]|jgi:F-type H+-transporting ATPase subunit b|nr:F0F1 ATP synthase subunit B [Deltaproteobacteria bacterium]
MKLNGKCSKIISITITFLIIMAIAAFAYASGGGEGAHGGGSLSTAKLKDLLWRVLNFTILLVVLVKVLTKPIANGLRARQQSIKEQFADLEERKAEADSTYQTYEKKLESIDQEIKDIIQSAVAQGEAEKERIIEEAKRAAEDIKRQAEMAIQQEMAEAKLKLREEVANQAVVMAEELIRKNLQEADQVKLIEDYLAKVGTVQ